MIARYWWLILLAPLLIAGIIYAGLHLHSIPPLIRLAGVIAWVAGAIGISLRSAGALLGPGLTSAEGWLWQAELDGSVAIAATCLPHGARPRPVGGNSVGKLAIDPVRPA